MDNVTLIRVIAGILAVCDTCRPDLPDEEKSP